MKKLSVLILAIWTLITLGFLGSAQADTLGLSLIMDGSGSISAADWALQLSGYASAIQNPAVVPQDGSVAINIIQFSTGAAEQIPFTVVDSQATADTLAAAILGIPQWGSLTCISCGIYLGKDTLLAFGFGDRMVIDVSTDGYWNTGIDPLIAAIDAVDNFGITAVNALGVGPSAVLGFAYGANSFEMTAGSYAEFADAIEEKIYKEVVPEPSTLLLLGSGLVGLAGLRRKLKVQR